MQFKAIRKVLQSASLFGFNATLCSYASKSSHLFNFDLHYFEEKDGWDGHRDRYQGTYS